MSKSLPENERPSPGPYAIRYSNKSKHRTAVFIVDRNGRFIGKVYGHEGQPVRANAALFAAAYKLIGKRKAEATTGKA